MNRRHAVFGLGAAGLAGWRPRMALAAAPAQLDLSALEARHGGRLGVAVETGGRGVQWRGAERFAYCSTFKLFLAAAILQRVARGEEKLDRAIAIAQSDMVPHAPTTGKAVGGTLTVAQLCKAAVELSDNPAANILIREIGGLDAWRAWYRGVGDEITRVDRLETELNTALPGDPRDTTTPAQAILNLKRVLTGGLLTAPHLALLQKWLVETPTGAGRTKAAVPRGYRVGHKTGTGANGPANDIGIIWPDSGILGSGSASGSARDRPTPIFIAVYFTECPDATSAQRDAVVADAARAALKGLEVG